jgi:hypothetical protein
VPYHLLPGNHDDRARLRAAFPDLPVDPQGFIQSALALTRIDPGVLTKMDPPEAVEFVSEGCRNVGRSILGLDEATEVAFECTNVHPSSREIWQGESPVRF